MQFTQPDSRGSSESVTRQRKKRKREEEEEEREERTARDSCNTNYSRDTATQQVCATECEKNPLAIMGKI